MLRSWEQFTGKKADLQPLSEQYERLKAKLDPVPFERFGTIESRARNIVVQRLLPGAPFCLSRIPYRERRKIDLSRLLWALFDGNRDLLTCIRIEDGETGTRTTQGQIKKQIDCLHYLERYGYVRLRPRA